VAEIRRITVYNQPGQIICETWSPNTEENGGGVTQGAEHLLWKCQALSSNPSLSKKNKINKKGSEGSSSTCLSRARPRVQIPVLTFPPKKNKDGQISHC
jgi:hypothetical protein